MSSREFTVDDVKHINERLSQIASDIVKSKKSKFPDMSPHEVGSLGLEILATSQIFIAHALALAGFDKAVFLNGCTEAYDKALQSITQHADEYQELFKRLSDEDDTD
jgi:hypothetical protein